jgi:transcriptional antiterminator RfaH
MTDLLDTTEKWRVIRGKPKAEHLAAQHLRAAGFQSFCPRIRHQRGTARGKVWFVEALFPGYLFARFAAVQLRHVASVPFVSQVMNFMEDCGSVSDNIVADLRASVDEKETITVLPPIRVGDSVDLVAGPLRGQTAVVTKLVPGAERVRILLEFLGNLREVEISILELLSGRDPRSGALPARAA